MQKEPPLGNIDPGDLLDGNEQSPTAARGHRQRPRAAGGSIEVDVVYLPDRAPARVHGETRATYKRVLHANHCGCGPGPHGLCLRKGFSSGSSGSGPGAMAAHFGKASSL